MLEPLRTPQPVNWWPPAPGWWLLMLLALILLALAARALLRWRARGAPLREARQLLEEIAAASTTAAQRAAALGQLHRRVAMALVGRAACAGLTGQAWADLLDALSRSDERSFDNLLTQLPYQSDIREDDVDVLIAATRSWLKNLEPGR
jgi:hypothetical protein